MNQSELINAVAESAGLTKTIAAKAVDAVTHAIAAALKEGSDVRLVGFGTFSVAERDSRQGRTPALVKPSPSPPAKRRNFPPARPRRTP